MKYILRLLMVALFALATPQIASANIGVDCVAASDNENATSLFICDSALVVNITHRHRQILAVTSQPTQHGAEKSIVVASTGNSHDTRWKDRPAW